jgi:ComF family protein
VAFATFMGVRGWVDGLASALLPDACVACDEVLGEHEGEGAFCERCLPEVLELPALGCPRCAEPGRFETLCPRCLTAPKTFERAWAAFEHEGAIARAVHRFKYVDRADLARPLGALLARRAELPLRRMPGRLVPIPLHLERFQVRQFDQAALLAVELGRRTGRPVEASLLRRVRHTSRQVGLLEHEREENVRGAFDVDGTVRGEDVVLIDDVMTTGATAREAAGVLIARGARAISVVCLARARRELVPGRLVAEPAFAR